ncbi:MAG: hypothetical protein NC818_00115 [Candidatus Omnitrophica bacterium]|nr:hypothetical protein [Candidatus Omnitrophota bacterium]
MMYKKILMVIAVAVMLVSICGIREIEACGRGPTQSPIMIALKYLVEICEANKIDASIGNILSADETIRYLDAIIPSIRDDFTAIAKDVDLYFRLVRGSWVPEQVISVVEAYLRHRGYGGMLDNALSYFAEDWSFLPEEGIDLTALFGGLENLEKKSTMETLTVTTNINPSGVISLTTTRQMTEKSLIDWLRDWFIFNRKMGIGYNSFVDMFKNHLPIIVNSPDLDNFFRAAGYTGGFDKGNWFHVSEALYWAGTLQILSSNTPDTYQREGLNLLKEQAEAILGKTLGKGSRFSTQEAIEVTSKMIRAGTELISYVEKYIGRKIDLAQSYDKGLLSSYVDGIFGRIRNLYYNPATKTWKPVDYNSVFTKAINDMKKVIDIGVNKIGNSVYLAFFKDKGGSDYMAKMRAYNVVMGSQWDEAQHVRAILNSWSYHVINIEDYTGNPTGALNLVKTLLEYDKGEGKVFKDKVDTFLGIKLNLLREFRHQQAYSNMVSLIGEVLSRADYFKISQGNIDQAYNAVKEMLDLAQGKDTGGKTLLDKIAGYLFPSISGARRDSLEMTSTLYGGTISGIATFWTQVLYARTKQLGDFNKAMAYVDAQLSARKEIRQALEKKFGIPLMINPAEIKYEDLRLLNLFESVLDGDLANLENTKRWVIDYINSDKVRFANFILQNAQQVELDLEAYKKANVRQPLYPEYPTAPILTADVGLSGYAFELPLPVLEDNNDNSGLATAPPYLGDFSSIFN